MRKLTLVVGVALALPAAAQEPPKPGPEHEVLKKLEGTWDITTKAGGMEAKGTMTYRMELGGLWLVGSRQTLAPGSPARQARKIVAPFGCWSLVTGSLRRLRNPKKGADDRLEYGRFASSKTL